MRGRDEPDGEDLTSRPHPRVGQLGLDGAEPAEGLPERVDRCEPAEALAGVDQALIAEELEGLADRDPAGRVGCREGRSEEHTSELQSLMRISYAVFCLQKKKTQQNRY